MMKTRTKVVALALSAVLLVVATVFATVAYLTANDEVVNTFTVGKVSITLDETDVNLNGERDGDVRVKQNTYKLMPGREYVKDPTIHVAANSEDCWLFVKVTNDITAIEGANTVAAQMTANGWTPLAGTTGVYTRTKQLSSATVQDVPVFESFTIQGDLSSDALAAYDTACITVTAYAVQAEGFDTAAAAWNATFGSK